MNWIYEGLEIPSDHTPRESSFGFIYEIEYTNGKKYIGKKQLWSKRRVPPLKGMRKNAVRYSIKESDWQKYEGSSKKSYGLTIKHKRIIELCEDKINLTYCEYKWLMRLDVLCSDEYLNDNIGGKFYSGLIEKGI